MQHLMKEQKRRDCEGHEGVARSFVTKKGSPLEEAIAAAAEFIRWAEKDPE